MPRQKQTIPAYSLHKSSGQACIYVNRQREYLGAYGSPESRKRYGERLAELAAGIDRQPATTHNYPQTRTVNELLLRYVSEHLPKYSGAEQDCQRGVIRIVRELFGETAVDEFGPIKLRTVRTAMLDKGWSVGFTNRQVKRLRYIFRLGVSWELCSQTTADALKSVPALVDDQVGSRQRRAIPEDQIQAVRAVLSPLHRDLLDLMLLVGCRPGELLGLTMADIDRSGEIWRADLATHKTRRFGKSRTLFFNATAQGILCRYLKADPHAKLFEIRRDTFGTAVKRACEIAFGMPEELRKPDSKLKGQALADVKRRAIEWRRQHVWTPHWLRHTVATRLADSVGTESAQRLLGHATRAMTEHYSKAAERVAMEAAKRLG